MGHDETNNQAIRLFLARHGNTFNAGEPSLLIGSKIDLSLTEKGHEQAQQLADYFKKNNIHFKHIYCGNLARQQQTAQCIADVQSVLLEPGVDALDELDYGVWEGLTDAQISMQWPEAFHDWSEYGVWPNAIFPMAFDTKQNRIYDWLNNIRKTTKNPREQIILAVSSGGIIRLFLSLIPQIWKNIDFRKYKVGTGHFCELLVFPDKIEIIQWNQTPYV